MGNKLFCSAWTNCAVSAVFFPTVFFFSELLQPSIFEHDVDCTLGIFHGYPLANRVLKISEKQMLQTKEYLIKQALSLWDADEESN